MYSTQTKALVGDTRIALLVYLSFSVEMNASTTKIKRMAWNWKTKRKWLFILSFLVVFVGFLYYASGPLFMEKAKHGKEPTQNNIAFVMQLEQENEKRLVFRFQQCLASICQHASIGLTIHIFANSLGKDESTKVLDVLTAECLNGLKVKFYDIEQVLLKLLPSINIIKVSELYCTWFRPGTGVVTCSAGRQLHVSEKAGERGGIEGGGGRPWNLPLHIVLLSL